MGGHTHLKPPQRSLMVRDRTWGPMPWHVSLTTNPRSTDQDPIERLDRSSSGPRIRGSTESFGRRGSADVWYTSCKLPLTLSAFRLHLRFR